MPDHVVGDRTSLSDNEKRAQVYEILNRVGALSVEEIQRKEDMIL